jgi:hypothetical protein
MRITWVLADATMLDPGQDVAELKSIGSTWGSWRTWRAYGTDNVVCHDVKKASELLKRAFQAVCNFYIPNENYIVLDRPMGVHLYEGNFVHDLNRQEEIVALHLAASQSDIVLLTGFDVTETQPNPDVLKAHQEQHYLGLFRQVIVDNPDIQWVLVDHPGAIRESLSDLPNLTQDTMPKVLELLGS